MSTYLAIGMGTLSGLLGVWCVFSESRYRKSRRALQKLKAVEFDSFVDATSAAKKAPYQGLISGKIRALGDKEVPVFSETRPGIVSLWGTGSEDNIRAVRVGSKFVLEDDKKSMPVIVSPGNKTRSFCLPREVKTYSPMVIGVQALFAAIMNPFWPHVVAERQEYFAFDGQHISLFGTLSYNPSKGALEMKNAKYLFTGSKKDVENYLEGISSGNWWRVRTLETVTGVCLAIAVYAGWQSFQRWYVKMRETRHIQQVQEEMARILADPQGSFRCVACCENMKNVVYHPCKHLAVCQECDGQMEDSGSNRCPICRARIQGRTIIELK